MDESTRVTYLKELINMRHEFIRPEWYSDEAIDRYYKNVGTLIRIKMFLSYNAILVFSGFSFFSQ